MSDPARRALARVRDRAGGFLVRADQAVLPGIYAVISVSAGGTRGWLRRRGLPFLDPEAPAPRLADVDRTADHVVAQSRGTTAVLGAVTGVAGWLGVPPEVAGWALAHLRLAQRLAVVYGLDPMTDRGHAAVSRALAAGLQVELPEEGLVGLRLTELVARGGPEASDAAAVRARLLRGALWRAARVATGRVGRLVPVLAAGVSAVDNHVVTAEVGERMKDVLRRLAAAAPPEHGRVVEAVEVGRGTA